MQYEVKSNLIEVVRREKRKRENKERKREEGLYINFIWTADISVPT